MNAIRSDNSLSDSKSTRDLISPRELERLYSDNLLRQLMHVSQSLNGRVRELSAEKGYTDLKMSFATVMANAGFDSTRISDIATLNGMSKQAVSQVARELVELGYIRLVPDPEDGRARSIGLTGRGRSMIADSLRSVETVRQEISELIGAERLKTLEEIVSILVAKLPAQNSRRKS